MRVVRGMAQQLPFPPNTFDQIVSTFPSEYAFQTQTIAEIYRVLTPGGLLIILPVAWIRRGSSIERSLAWLYEITHQAPPRKDDQWKMEVTAGFRQAGFDVQTETATAASSEIFLVLASKPKVM
jgi:SAM-dependent methyltransferase